MRGLLSWFTQESEVEYLRKLVKEKDLQIMIMANKQMEYVNAKIATSMTDQYPTSVNADTGKLEQQLSPEEIKQQEMAKEEFRDIFAN